jgi:hypothetical protein
MIRPRLLQPSIGKKFAVIRIVPTTAANIGIGIGIIIGSTPAHSAREERVARKLLNHPPGRGPGCSYAELSQAIARLKCLIRLGITLDDVAESRDPSFLLP